MHLQNSFSRIFYALCTTGLVAIAAPAQVVLYSIDGSRPSQFSGTALATADIDGDGFSDLLIGGFDRTNNSRGSVAAYSGRTGAVIYELFGSRSYSALGTVLAGVGDVNGDGREDFIMASPTDSTRGTNAGAALVVSGATGGPIRTHFAGQF